MRRFSPFNALLLHRRKPGLRFAASARDWRRRWTRIVKADARPLVVLVPFGPAGFVYDMLDTEGLSGALELLPRDAFAFPVTGNVAKPALKAIVAAVEGTGIRVREVDEGDWHAGRILRNSGDAYTLKVNRNQAQRGKIDLEVPKEVPRGFVGGSRRLQARVGVWLMPDNRQEGTLEHFLDTLVQEGDSLFD